MGDKLIYVGANRNYIIFGDACTFLYKDVTGFVVRLKNGYCIGLDKKNLLTVGQYRMAKLADILS